MRAGRGALHRGRRRSALIGVGLMTLLVAFLAMVGTASAIRTFDSRISGFSRPSGVSFEADGTAWITDYGHTVLGYPNQNSNGLYKYSAYPSQTLLAVPNTYKIWGFFVFDLEPAVDQSSGEVYVAQSNGPTIDIFDENGGYTHSWTGNPGAAGEPGAGLHVAIDNTDTTSRGRIYLSLTSPADDIEMVDAAQRPIDFPATAGYIVENRLTGTPSGPFGRVENIAVDNEGNLYVVDTGKSVVDEFDWTGTFVKAFTGATAPGSFSNLSGVGVDPTNGDVLIGSDQPDNVVDEFDQAGNYLSQMSGTPGKESFSVERENLAVDPSGRAYINDSGESNSIDIFGPNAPLPTVAYEPVANPTATSGTLKASVDPHGSGEVTSCEFDYGTDTSYSLGSIPCSAATPYTTVTPVSVPLAGLTPETTYHYRVALTGPNGNAYGADQTFTPHHVTGLSTGAASDVTEHGATLNGSLLGNGSDTHYYFEWGATSAYGNTSPAPPGTDLPSPSGPAATPLSTTIGGLVPYTTYHYRVIAKAGGETSTGEDRSFTTSQGVPTGKEAAVTVVHADRALLHAKIDPNGADTTAHFEIVDDASFQANGWTDAVKVPLSEIGMGRSKHYREATTQVNGLVGGTLYHYRAVATNGLGTGTTEAVFTTFGFTPSINDKCPNAHVRQQTGASLLLDCRAYELVSAANAGGYDVESSLVGGQEPFGDYPDARSASGEPQVLYGIHNGGIPGTGKSTNHGGDPYVATRGPEGWTTKYVGIPADDPSASGPFASTILEADAGLNTFAFGGPEICSPCFSDTSTGVPLHLPDGELIQGMAGATPHPTAEPAGYVAKKLSADGSHFVFGSTAKFESDGNEGEISIYDRNLTAKTTSVVSKTPAGANLPCLTHCTTDGIGELDIAKDGARVVVGQLVSETEGNKYWHLYMNVGDSDHTIDLTPGATHGVLYDGMTSDGSKVYFTATDALTGDDEDTSADIYRADVTGSSSSLTGVSTGPGSAGGPGNSDSCHPAANTVHALWNTTGTEETCGVVAIGGGGGVASQDGTIYFLSPEALDTSNPSNLPVANAPNLYVARPGSAPHFIRTLESSANAPVPPPAHPFVRAYGTFANPVGVAIDHANGDVYVLDDELDNGTAYVYKFDSTGHAVTSFANNGKLTVSGTIGFFRIPTQIAVDNDPGSPNHGDLFVPDYLDSTVNKFSSSGDHLETLSVERPSAVGVDASTGKIYVAAYLSSAVFVFNSDGTAATNFPVTVNPTGVAVGSGGKVYVVNGGGFFGAQGTAEIYSPAGTDLGQLDGGPAYGVSVDPVDDHVYVDHIDRVVEFDPSGGQVGNPFGVGEMVGSNSLAADAGRVDVSNHKITNVLSYGPAAVPPDRSTDSPVVLDSVSSSSARHTADFEVSPSGDFAAFPSSLQLTGYDNAVHEEIFRYDASTDSLDCASCNPTGEQATGEAAMAPDGLSLSDDGRVFFTSTEGLADRDLNDVVDAYEWEPEQSQETVGGCHVADSCIELISTGAGPSGATLLGISGDGTDAYFFTPETLVTADQNGSRVKIYDARAGGGYPEVPAPIPCKASDECHGPGSKAPPPTNIKTIAGTPVGNANSSPATCPKHRVRRHGKCVKPHRKHHRKHHRRKS